MPIIPVSLEETEANISRPVVLDVVRKLLARMRMNPSQPIVYNGSSEFALLPNSPVGRENRNLESPNYLPSTEKIFIETTEIDEQWSVLEQPTLYPEHRYVFFDKTINTGLRPRYQHQEVTINFRARFRSRALADRWRNNMNQLLSRGLQTFIFDVTYNYLIPIPMLVALRHLWGLREAVAGYNDGSFSEWMHKCCPRLTGISDPNGNKVRYGIGEMQANIQGWWDFDITPYASKQSNGTWVAEFAYKFEYDKVTSLIHHYPVSVHNQLIPEALWPKRMTYDFNEQVVDKPFQQQRYERTSQKLGHVNNKDDRSYPIVPYFDEWYIKHHVNPHLKHQYQVLCCLNPDDRSDIVNLNQLGENEEGKPYTLSYDALMYIKRRGWKVFLDHKTLVRISVYSNDTPINANCLTIDEDLNIRCTYKLNPRRQYHVVISIDTEVSAYDEETTIDACGYGYNTLNVLWPEVPVPEPNENGQIPITDWNDMFDRGNRHHRSTIGDYTIVALRDDQASHKGPLPIQVKNSDKNI